MATNVRLCGGSIPPTPQTLKFNSMTKAELIQYMNGLSDESVVSVKVDLGSGLVFTSDSQTHDIVVDVHDPIKSLAGQKWTEHEIQIRAKKK
jgi:hypothetical protein